jgi:hypothetical protein
MHPGVPVERRREPGIDPNDIELSEGRDRLLHTFGNLTLLTSPLNSAVSNSAFAGGGPLPDAQTGCAATNLGLWPPGVTSQTVRMDGLV